MIAANLITDIIAGIDFLSINKVIIDFNKMTLASHFFKEIPLLPINQIRSANQIVGNTEIFSPESDYFENRFSAVLTANPEEGSSFDYEDEDCSIPYSSIEHYEYPESNGVLKNVIEKFKFMFTSTPGKTNIASHFIPTGNNGPSKLPSRPIPFHYWEKVTKQLNGMLQD